MPTGQLIHHPNKLHHVHKDTNANIKDARQQGYYYVVDIKSTETTTLTLTIKQHNILWLVKPIRVSDSVERYVEQVVIIKELFGIGVAE